MAPSTVEKSGSPEVEESRSRGVENRQTKGRPRPSRARATGQKAAQGSPENHAMFVIPAKAGIHLSPDPQWVPAFAGMTLIFIRSGGRLAHDGSSPSRLLTVSTTKSGEQSENVYENKGSSLENSQRSVGVGLALPLPGLAERRGRQAVPLQQLFETERNKARMSMKTKEEDKKSRVRANGLTVFAGMMRHSGSAGSRHAQKRHVCATHASERAISVPLRALTCLDWDPVLIQQGPREPQPSREVGAETDLPATLGSQLGQSLYRPAVAVLAPEKVVGLGEIKFHLLRIPFQRGLGKARSDASQQDGFRKRTGIGEACGGFALPTAGIDELGIVIDFADVGDS